MSSVRKNERSSHKFTVLDACLDLYEHTTTITAGKKFENHRWIADKMNRETMTVYHYCRSANEDYDAREANEAKIRLELEDKAIELCMWLKTDIMLAKKLIHLRVKQVIFWTEMTNKTLALIKAWRKSEQERYKENNGL